MNMGPLRLRNAAGSVKSRWRFWLALTLVFAVSQPTFAADISANALQGDWCGKDSNYTFSSKQLIVRSQFGQLIRKLEIARVDLNGDRISVFWTPLNPHRFTVFLLNPDKLLLTQLANRGGPQRVFYKCRMDAQ